MTDPPSLATDSAEPPAAAERSPARLGSSYRKLFAASTISNLGDGMGLVVYPWLASAITRNPLLIALVAVAQRLPWLVFSLPAGVITDRVDRRRLIVGMNTLRGFLTLVVAFAVLGRQSRLPGPDELDQVLRTDGVLYAVVVTATLLLGMAEVLADNAGQTLMPSVVDESLLERANGRLWSAEMVMNTWAGPPLGSLLLAVAFSIPIFVDAGTFLAAAALIAAIPGVFRAASAPATVGLDTAGGARPSWIVELKEGVRWLWGHSLLRPMAIILGLMNLAGMISGATFVLWAQEVLRTSPVTFAVVGMGAAVGGVLGGWLTERIAARLGSGTCLAITLASGVVTTGLMGLVTWWPLAFVLLGVEVFFGTLWNVITVSLRQRIIPDHLLGRVNSVYRFFAWGMLPIGAAIGGAVVLIADRFTTRGWALRSTWFVAAAVLLGLFLFGRIKLTTAKIEAARAAAG